MRSRWARLIVCTIVWVGFGAAGYFLFISQQLIATRRATLRTFDVHAREAVEALADVRAAQQAYVARGQGALFWMPKVTDLMADATTAVERLRESATSTEALASLVEAANTITEFGDVDRRAREYSTRAWT